MAGSRVYARAIFTAAVATPVGGRVGMAEDSLDSGAGTHPDGGEEVNPMLAAALANAAIGLPVFPCNKDKRPLTSHGFKDATTDPSQILRWWTDSPEAMVGMPTGEDSQLVVLDVDENGPKNKNGEESLDILLESHGFELPRTLTARTPSGGRHLYFRHPGVKVANRTNCPGDCIDIRGDGGYVILPPSISAAGQYTWIDDAEIAPMPEWLLRMVQTKTSEAKTSSTSTGVTSKAHQGSQTEVVRIHAALTFIDASDRTRWFKVGLALKSRFGDDGWNLFDEWSQTAPESYDADENRTQWETFKSDGGVTIATLFHLAKESGWKSALTRSNAGIKSEYLGGPEATAQTTVDVSSLAQRLESRTYSASTQPTKPEPRFSLADIPICTPGNLTAISAPAKAGKSAVINAMLASTFRVPGADCLGFTACNAEGKAVLHIDTEQSVYDHWYGIEVTKRRAKVEVVPPWLRSYCLTGFSPAENLISIRILLEQALNQFGGIHSAFIDGIADVVNNVNDPDETGSLVAELQKLAIEFDCPIINVIHVNPSSDSKTRGHLGSQLERKSETNLRLDKNDEGVTVVWADKNRRAPIPKATAPRFAWDNVAGMHVAVASRRSAADDAAKTDLRRLAEKMFENGAKKGLGYSEVIKFLERAKNCSESTAKRKLKQMVRSGVVQKGINQSYSLTAA